MKIRSIFYSKLFWIAVISLIMIFIIVYYQLLYKAKEVNSGIAKLEKVFSGHTSVIWKVKFSPTGNLLATASVDSTVKIWTMDGTIQQQLKHPQGVTYLDFSPDGRFIITGSYDGICRLWDINNGRLVREFKGHAGTVWSVNFNPDGRTIASSGDDAIIRIWDTGEGRLIHTLKAHTLTVWCIKFSPDGKTLASGSFDNSVKIWAWEKNLVIKNIKGHTEAVVELAYSHDGHKLATTSDDKTIKLWSTIDFRLLQTFTVPEHVQAIAFSPDNKYLITGGKDKPAIGELLQNFLGDSWINKGISARLWEISTGKLLQTFARHANDVNDVAYSPDGQWIATASSDRTVHLWKLTNK